MKRIEMAVRIVCFVSIVGCAGETSDRKPLESESARLGGKLTIEPARHQADPATDAFVRLTIRVRSKPGPFREFVTIRTDLAEAREILVPVSGIVEDRSIAVRDS